MPYALRDSYIFYSGAMLHVANNCQRLFNYENETVGFIRAGKGHLLMKGFRDLIVQATQDGKPMTILLKDVAYIPRFQINVVSLNRFV